MEHVLLAVKKTRSTGHRVHKRCVVLYSPSPINCQLRCNALPKQTNKRKLLKPRYAFHVYPDRHELVQLRHYRRHMMRVSHQPVPKIRLAKSHLQWPSSFQYLLAASADVTTGGNGHLDWGVVISPRGGSAGADLGV